MTHNTTKASASRQANSTTTKSHCPAGAGLINQGEATKAAHTPPQACATPAIDRAIATTRKAPHAQLAEGYEHPQPATTGHTTTEETAMTATKEQIVQGFLAAECQRFDAVTHPLTLGEKQVALRAVDYTIAALTPEEQANTIRTQHEVIQGLAGLLRAIRDKGHSEELAQEIHQVLQTYAPCNTCGGGNLECPDCDGARIAPPPVGIDSEGGSHD